MSYVTLSQVTVVESWWRRGRLGLEVEFEHINHLLMQLLRSPRGVVSIAETELLQWRGSRALVEKGLHPSADISDKNFSFPNAFQYVYPS